MKTKRRIMRLIAAACAAAVLSMQGAAGAAQAEAMGGILRLHIMANSDSAADQRAKLAVRDAVLEAMGGMRGCKSEAEAEMMLMQSGAEVLRTAEDTLKKCGMEYGAQLVIGEFEFPDRVYAGILYPKGKYRALRIILGEGVIVHTLGKVDGITPKFSDNDTVSKTDVVEFIKNQRLASKNPAEAKALAEDDDPTNDNVEIPEELEPWRTELAETLHSMDPYAFERLSMLLLRECGFSQVSVTKKSGDGGIDGTGKLRINGIFSFNVAFQCKRFVGSVSAGDIRDFRGSLTTDIEKGVFITTGTFTKAARDEASNAGKQQIDLIDGEEFINKLIEYRLGVREKTIYEVDKSFFEKV